MGHSAPRARQPRRAGPLLASELYAQIVMEADLRVRACVKVVVTGCLLRLVKLRDGTLLKFPSYLEPSVDANTSDEERIRIRFNVMFSRGDS
jgi:hypothetical protein